MSKKARDLDNEIFTALTNCIAEAAPLMAKKYQLPEQAVKAMFPRILNHVALEAELKEHEWQADEIKQLCHTIYMLLNGAHEHFSWRKE